MQFLLLFSDLNRVLTVLIPNAIEEALLLQFNKTFLDQNSWIITLFLAELEFFLGSLKDFRVLDKIIRGQELVLIVIWDYNLGRFRG